MPCRRNMLRSCQISATFGKSSSLPSPNFELRRLTSDLFVVVAVAKNAS